MLPPQFDNYCQSTDIILLEEDDQPPSEDDVLGRQSLHSPARSLH
jgi:hypothetical protein